MKLRTTLRPTIVGRAVLLVTGLLIANAACWAAAGICLSGADGLLGIAMLAWVSPLNSSEHGHRTLEAGMPALGVPQLVAQGCFHSSIPSCSRSYSRPHSHPDPRPPARP